MQAQARNVGAAAGRMWLRAQPPDPTCPPLDESNGTFSVEPPQGGEGSASMKSPAWGAQLTSPSRFDRRRPGSQEPAVDGSAEECVWAPPSRTWEPLALMPLGQASSLSPPGMYLLQLGLYRALPAGQPTGHLTVPPAHSVLFLLLCKHTSP